MRLATPADTPAIYRLLDAVRFAGLPSYDEARFAIENSHSIVIEKDGKVAAWVNVHLHDDNKHAIDVAVLPEYRGRLVTKDLCKQVLTYCLTLCDCLYAEAYNPRAVKLALLLGFELSAEQEREGWVKLVYRKRK